MAVTARLGVLWLLLAALVAAPAAADFLNSYKHALAALEGGDWAAAEEHLRAALAERPEEDKRLLKGLFLKPYLPHYHLGVALAEQGDCRGALAAWAESERQGIITEREDDYQDLKRRRGSCEGVLAALGRATEAARLAVARADAAAAALASLAAQPELARRWDEGDPSPRHRQREAVQRLEAARRELEAGTLGSGSLERLEAAAAGAEEALRRLDTLRREAEGERGRVLEARQALLAELDQAVATALTTAAAAAELGSPPPAIAALTRELERLLAARRNVADTTPPADLEALRDRLTAATGRLDDALQPPPGQLFGAAQALLSGRHRQVVEILGEIGYRDRRSRAHAHLLRAAARFHLYESGGRQDEELLAAVRQDIQSAHQADPSLTPPARLLPPRFLALWEEETTSGRGDPAAGRGSPLPPRRAAP